MFRIDFIAHKADKDNSPRQQDPDPDVEANRENIEAFTPPSREDVFAKESLAMALEATKDAVPGEQRKVTLPTPVIIPDPTELRTNISSIEGGPHPLVIGLVGNVATVLCVSRQQSPDSDSKPVRLGAD